MVALLAILHITEINVLPAEYSYQVEAFAGDVWVLEPTAGEEGSFDVGVVIGCYENFCVVGYAVLFFEAAHVV